MIPSITDIRRSLSDCQSSFSRLTAMRPVEGCRPQRTSRFAEFGVAWREGRWLLCTPLTADAVGSVERMASQLKRVRSEFLTDYEVYRSELEFADSAGGRHACDVVMQRMPDGASLQDVAAVSSRERLCGRLRQMQREFARMGFAHNNLKPCNIILADDERPVAVRYHFASFGDDAGKADAAAFDELERYVMSLPESDEESPLPSAGESAPDRGVMLPGGCERVGTEHEQMVVIRREGMYGYADARGTIVVAPQFDCAGDFREGRAEVEYAGRMGLVDKSGKYVIAPEWEYLEYRDDCGISLVLSDGMWSAIDYEGHPTGIRCAAVADVCRLLRERMNIVVEP